jgi:hypothetical protein
MAEPGMALSFDRGDGEYDVARSRPTSVESSSHVVRQVCRLRDTAGASFTYSSHR